MRAFFFLFLPLLVCMEIGVVLEGDLVGVDHENYDPRIRDGIAAYKTWMFFQRESLQRDCWGVSVLLTELQT